MHEPFLNHVSEETLESYVLGKLAEPDQDNIEDHLLVCHGCRRRLFDIERFVTAIRTAAANFGGAGCDLGPTVYRHTITRYWPALTGEHN